MKKYHPIGEQFNVTFLNGKKIRMVAVECETVTGLDGSLLRKTCKGCYFAKLVSFYCSGYHRYDTECKQGGCKYAKCSPEYREDNKHIHYKKVVIQ